MPQEDGAVISGVTISGGGDASDLFSYRNLDYYGTFTTGDEFVGVWDAYGSYLETGDTGFTFKWAIYARGSGTIDLTQDTDPDWDTTTMPTAPVSTLTVGAMDWTEYLVPANSIVLADFLDFDGIRLGLTGASGTVDIRCIQLRCVPDSGPYGWWRNQPSYDDSFATNVSHNLKTVLDDDNVTGGADPVSAAGLAYSNNVASDPLHQTPVTSAGFFGPHLGGFMLDWVRCGYDAFGVPFGSVATGAGLMSVYGGPSDTNPDGYEGTDYIRIPDYTLYDDDNYVRSAANRANPPSSFVNWVTPHIWYRNDLGTYQSGDYNNLQLWMSVYYQEWDGVTVPSIPDYETATLIHQISTVDAEITIEEITLPSAGNFLIWLIPSQLDEVNGAVPNFGVLAPTDGGGVYFSGEVSLQTSDEPEINNHKALQRITHHEASSVWDPNETPPGGILMMTKGDGTSVPVGDPEATHEGRLVMKENDGTEWIEYRTTDGALTTREFWVTQRNAGPFRLRE